MKQTLHTIWNSEVKVEDFADMFKELETNGEAVPEDEKEAHVYELNSTYLDDEKINLNVTVENPIICIARLGLWNGVHVGYHMLGNNLSECLVNKDDEVKFYCDKYNFRAIGKHHDGTNTYMFRELRKAKYEGVVIKKLLDGTLSDKELSRYTKGLRTPVANVYGW